MSISTALKSSVSGLKAVEKQISVVAGNISNANTPGYTKQRALLGANVVAGDVQGVSILGIQSSVNENVNSEIRAQSGELSQQNTLVEFYSQIELVYGSPGITPGLNDRVNDFYAAIQALNDDPEILSIRQNAVSNATELASFISQGADSLHNLRFEADRQLDSAYGSVNTLTERMQTLNKQVASFEKGTSGFESVRREQNNVARELSEFFAVSISTNDSGQYSLSGPGGVPLLDARQYRIDYTASASADSLAEGLPFAAAELVQLKEDGTVSGTSENAVLVSAGASADVTTDIQGGKIKALLDLRDGILPELIDQLDSFTKNFKDDINAAHNNGVSFPPPSELTGNREVFGDTQLQFSGGATLQLVQADGSPAFSPYAGEEYFPPFELDFDALNGGDGNGKFSVDDLLNEINNHFGSPTNKASVGPLNNVGLVLTDDRISDGGSADFTLEYSNFSANAADVKILSVEVQDPVDNSALYPAVTVPADSATVNGGATIQDSTGFTLDFGTDDNRDEYNVNVTVQVTDANGDVHESTVQYLVTDDISDSRNKRFTPQDQTVNSGDGAFSTAPSGTTLLQAERVNADGDLAADNEPGVLRLQGTNGRYIAIAEGDSKHLSTSGGFDNGTDKAFSAFFGLNDLFVSGSAATDDRDGQALNFGVREDIRNNPAKIAVGTLERSPQPSDDTQARYTYEYGSGNNGAARAISETSSDVSDFEGTSGLPATSSTFTAYAVSITAFMATNSGLTSKNQEIEQFAFDGLLELNQELTGVDVDSELAFVLELEAQYNASATVIGTMKSLLDTLNGIFR